jgi:TolA-binding protein
MNNTINDFFEDGDCPSENELSNYIEGKCSDADANKIEAHLLNCEMCSDALEGLSLLNPTSKINSINTELHQKIDQLTETTKTRILFPWQIAAAFILLFASAGLLWFFVPKNPTDTLTLESQKSDATPKESIVTLNTPDNVDSNLSIQGKVSEKSRIDYSNPKVVLDEVSSANGVSYNEDPTEAEATACETVLPPLPVAAQEEALAVKDLSKSDQTAVEKFNSVTTTSAGSVTTSEAKESIKSKAVLAKKSAAESEESNVDSKFEATSNTNYFELGVKAYKSGSYQSALQLLQNVNSPNEVFYYRGMSAFALGDSKNAISQLKKYVISPKKELEESANFNLGKAYYNSNEMNSAKKQFEKVIKMHGVHFAEASELLNKLNK